ncbi:hypothetical protein Trydic_g4509 [Trypoxylus dichotomus]
MTLLPQIYLLVISCLGLPILRYATTNTSIQLHWTPSLQPYIAKYEGSDLCSNNTELKNGQRLKSNNWLSTKSRDSTAIISNLVPFTHYTITFIDPVYGNNKTLSLNTNPTDKPTENEIPKLAITPKVNEVVIVIPPIQCNVSYGKIVYRLERSGQPDSQIVLDQSSFTMKKLKPYTNYTLTVQAARTIKRLNDSSARVTVYYNFTTKPQVAPSLEFVELYEISETLASFRYKLPEKANGQPVLVGIRACSSITPCYFEMFNITRCNLWKGLYCVTINNLVKKVYYIFKLSIKNNNTNAFGDEVEITSQSIDKVPGTPTNLSYTVRDCSQYSEVCNLNISWSHPYNQSGIIKSFEILLLGTGAPIIETLLVNNREYKPIYWHLVQHLLYATTYNLSVVACNLVHRGPAASIEVEIDHIGQHIDQTPTLLRINQEGVTFQLPKLDYRLNSSTVIVVVQQYGNEVLNLPENIISTTDNALCLQKGISWIAGAWKMSHNNETTVTIGDKAKIIVDIINTTNTKHIKIYHKDHIVLPEMTAPSQISSTNTNPSIITIVLLGTVILAVAILAVILYARRKQCRPRIRSDGEHIYEAMPNEDYNETYNVVYNAVYDKLNHD